MDLRNRALVTDAAQQVTPPPLPPPLPLPPDLPTPTASPHSEASPLSPPPPIFHFTPDLPSGHRGDLRAGACAYMRPATHAHAPAHARAHAHTHAYARTHALARTYTLTHARTHLRSCPHPPTHPHAGGPEPQGGHQGGPRRRQGRRHRRRRRRRAVRLGPGGGPTVRQRGARAGYRAGALFHLPCVGRRRWGGCGGGVVSRRAARGARGRRGKGVWPIARSGTGCTAEERDGVHRRGAGRGAQQSVSCV